MYICTCISMMMIAFITLNSSLVPWMEGLCSSNAFRFEFSVLRLQLLLFFFGRKNMLKKKISSRLPAYIYTWVLCTHKRIHTCQGFVHLGSSVPPKYLVPTPGLTSEYPTWSVCVCAVHTHTLPPPFKNRQNTNKILIFPHEKNIVHASNKCPA